MKRTSKELKEISIDEINSEMIKQQARLKENKFDTTAAKEYLKYAKLMQTYYQNRMGESPNDPAVVKFYNLKK